MKKLVAFLFLCTLLVSCQSKTDFQTVKVQKKYSLELPDYLTEVQNLNPDASLQYQNPLKEFYVIVLDEAKADFPNSSEINLDSYKNMLGENLKTNLDNPTFSRERDTVINGLQTKLFNLTDKMEGLVIYYQFAYVEGKDNFYQIMTWTLESRKDKFSKDMDRIIASFKELESKSRAK